MLAALLSLTLVLQSAPAASQPPQQAVVETTHGTFVFELLAGKAPDDATLAAAAAAIPADAIELDSRLASRAYRRRVAPVLAKHALADAAQAAGAPR